MHYEHMYCNFKLQQCCSGRAQWKEVSEYNDTVGPGDDPKRTRVPSTLMCIHSVENNERPSALAPDTNPVTLVGGSVLKVRTIVTAYAHFDIEWFTVEAQTDS